MNGIDDADFDAMVRGITDRALRRAELICGFLDEIEAKGEELTPANLALFALIASKRVPEPETF